MNQELLAEVDTQDNVVAIHPKEKLKELKFRHRISILLPKTTEGKFIFARRAKHKHPFPDVWVCAVGGKVRANETYEQACLREMHEEAGFKAQLQYVATSKLDLPEEKAIVHIFTTQEELSLKQFNLDQEETQYVQALSIQEMNAIIKEHPEQCAPTFIRHFNVFKEHF